MGEQAGAVAVAAVVATMEWAATAVARAAMAARAAEVEQAVAVAATQEVSARGGEAAEVEVRRSTCTRPGNIRIGTGL